MKALTIKQPWASLVMCGAKKIETRTWPAPKGIVGTRIAIASGQDRSHITIMQGALRGALVMREQDPDALPFGKMLGTVTLVRSEKMTPETMGTYSMHEQVMGYFTEGNYAWLLEDPEWLASSVPVRGKQGFYDWEP